MRERSLWAPSMSYYNARVRNGPREMVGDPELDYLRMACFLFAICRWSVE